MFILEFWHWWALALIFVVVEALMVSGVFAAFALASLITGMAFNSYPSLEWQLQLVIFATSTVVFFYIIRLIFGKRLSKDAAETQIPSELIGTELILKNAIQNGFGELEIDGTNWALKGPDCKPGTVVRVVSVDGHYLAVFPFNKDNPNHDDSTAES